MICNLTTTPFNEKALPTKLLEKIKTEKIKWELHTTNANP